MPTSRFLVTAGSTRERIDEVRDWGNIFSGNTGLAIASELASAGQVDLLTSNLIHLEELQRSQSTIQASKYASHAQLKESLAALMVQHRYDAVFMTAAVSDYKPVRVYSVLERHHETEGREIWTVQDIQAPKVKSSHTTIAVLGEQTEKLVDLFRKEWQHPGLLIKFKLEVGIGVEELLRVAELSRRSSGADFLVANTLEMVEGANAGAYLVGDRGARWIKRADLPAEMLALTKA